MNAPSEVREMLDVVVRDDARAVQVDARSAWQSGRQRRTRNRIGLAAAALAVVGIGVASIAVLDDRPTVIGPASDAGDTATEHPLRLEHMYWDDDLPEMTGPLAGVVQRNGESTSGWYSVSPEGHLWEIDTTFDYVPAVSPDGSHLAYMRGDIEEAVYVITNQVDGTEETFPQIGTGAAIDATFAREYRYFNSGQTPSFWSPGGTAVLVRVGLTDTDAPEPEPVAAVLRPDGTSTVVPHPAEVGSYAFPIGWFDDDRIVLAGRPASGGRARVWIVDVETGEPVRDFSLEMEDDSLSQWLGSISPDGNELASTAGDDRKVRSYALRGPLQGRLVTAVPAVPATADTCPLTWTSDNLHVPTATHEGDAVLVSANGGTTVLADPRLDIVCSIWARTAIEGPEHQSLGTRLFGDDTSWISWHWREVALSSLLLTLLLSGGIVTAVVRRRARRAA